MFSHQKSVKKPFLLYNFPQKVLFCQNKSQLSNLQNGHREKLFLTPHFWPFKKQLDKSEIMSSHQKSVKKPFLLYNFSPGSCFAKIRVSCQTFKMDIERSFSLTPHFWPFKNHSTGQKSCFLIRRVLKSLFSIWQLPQGVLFCQNKSQLSNLQNGHGHTI